MKRGVRIIFQAAVILFVPGMKAKAQPVQITEIPDNCTNFRTVGDLTRALSTKGCMDTCITDFPVCIFSKTVGQ
jgi:hypothetical protein